MYMPRVGDWSLTFSGRQIWPLDPRPEDIFIEDVAHHLSCINRFCGATREPYSVAQHCCHVSDLLPEHLRFEGLHHDDPEFVLNDLHRPLKYGLPQYLELEKIWWAVIAAKYGLTPVEPCSEVKRIDNVLVVTERRDLLPAGGPQWEVQKHYQPDPNLIIQPWPAWRAEHEFLERHVELLSWRKAR